MSRLWSSPSARQDVHVELQKEVRQVQQHPGRERVIAGSDCGFGTFAGFGAVDADIVYAKFEAMAQGGAMVGAARVV